MSGEPRHDGDHTHPHSHLHLPVHTHPHTHNSQAHTHPHEPEDPHEPGAGDIHATEVTRSHGPHPAPQPWGSRPPTPRPTPLVYVDCFSGIAGDMLLGALLDAGLALEHLETGLAALDLHGYRLDIQTKQSYGITGTKLDVVVDESVQPERRLRDILDLLERSTLPDWVQNTASAVFGRLAQAEAKIHHSTVDDVHFHEVGAVDSIVDVVGGLIGLHALGITQVFASSLPLPGGTVRAAHGLLPAPAPATLEILATVGAPTRPAPVLGELVTPTGAAILAELATFEQPLMRVHRVGYGYGTKELPWPNAVRVWLGEAWSPQPPRLPSGHAPSLSPPPPVGAASDSETPVQPGDAAPITSVLTALPEGVRRDEVVVIEANIDDMTPELLGYAMERLFAAGALDVAFTALQMKKQRPGTLLTVIGRPADTNVLAATVLRETSTLGVRVRRSERLVADRRQETVATPYGTVRVKYKLIGRQATPAPEYDDCAALARMHGVAISEVYRAALLAASP